MHSQLGEQDQAISCYQQALALAREWKTPMARRMLASVLTDFGDACRATRDPSEAVGAWQRALQILDDLRLPDSLGVRERLEQASPPSSTD